MLGITVNAAIEAASAGCSGNGFGVVAEEIGNLSTQTTKCTNEVDKINQNMIADSELSWRTLGQFESDLLQFAKESDNVIEEIIKLPAIEENGFIVTTLAKRLEDHAEFMKNLLRTAGAAEKITDHQHCAFGKWYEENKGKYRLIPEYSSIYEPHKAFHDKAIEFNKTKSIDVLIEFLHLSREVLNRFLSLANYFKEDCQKNDSYFKGLI